METGGRSVSGIVNEFVPATLPEHKLPTYDELLKYYLYLKKHQFNKSDYALQLCVAEKLQQMWNSVKIPIILTKSIVNKLKGWFAKYETILKHGNKRKNPEDLRQKLDQLLDDGKKLFDIAKCKCTLVTTCECSEDAKVGAVLKEFLNDQRHERSMTLIQAKRVLADHGPPVIDGCDVLEGSPELKTQPSNISSEPLSLAEVPKSTNKYNTL